MVPTLWCCDTKADELGAPWSCDFAIRIQVRRVANMEIDIEDGIS